MHGCHPSVTLAPRNADLWPGTTPAVTAAPSPVRAMPASFLTYVNRPLHARVRDRGRAVDGFFAGGAAFTTGSGSPFTAAKQVRSGQTFHSHAEMSTSRARIFMREVEFPFLLSTLADGRGGALPSFWQDTRSLTLAVDLDPSQIDA